VADINYSINVLVSKDNLNSNTFISGVTATMDQTGLQTQTITVSTSSASATSISTANLTAVGLAFLRNLSTATASTVQVGLAVSGTFYAFSTLRAGEPAVLRLTPGASYKAIGDSTARLRVDITEG
jgi:hypothetical protein